MWRSVSDLFGRHAHAHRKEGGSRQAFTSGPLDLAPHAAGNFTACCPLQPHALRTWLMRRAMVAISSSLVGSFSSFFTSR